MSHPPRVSVVIPTHDRAELLLEAIASVRAQTRDDWELIVADDGSTDATPERMASLDGVRYLRLEHGGRPEATRNRAVAVARGELIAFLDDDDVWEPDKLAVQVPLFDADPSLGLAYGDVRVLHPDGSLSPPLLRPHEKRSDRVFDHLLEACFIHPSTVVLRRRLFERVGPFPDRFFSQGDYWLWLHAAHAAPVRCVARPLARIRRHAPRRLSVDRDLLHYECAIEVLEDVRVTLPLTRPQRRRARRALARHLTHVGKVRMAAGGTAAGRRLLRRALLLDPLRGGAWRALLGVRSS